MRDRASRELSGGFKIGMKRFLWGSLDWSTDLVASVFMFLLVINWYQFLIGLPLMMLADVYSMIAPCLRC